MRPPASPAPGHNVLPLRARLGQILCLSCTQPCRRAATSSRGVVVRVLQWPGTAAEEQRQRNAIHSCWRRRQRLDAATGVLWYFDDDNNKRWRPSFGKQLMMIVVFWCVMVVILRVKLPIHSYYYRWQSTCARPRCFSVCDRIRSYGINYLPF